MVFMEPSLNRYFLFLDLYIRSFYQFGMTKEIMRDYHLPFMVDMLVILGKCLAFLKVQSPNEFLFLTCLGYIDEINDHTLRDIPLHLSPKPKCT